MKVMELNHESIMSGHLKIDKTLDRIKDKFFWPKLRSDVKDFIERCIICQKTSVPKNKIRIPLNPLRPSYSLEIVTTDILGPIKTKLLELLDIRRLRTSTFYPECDGLSERLNRTLKRMIKCYINDNHDNWDVLLPALSFAYNTATNSTTKFTPYEFKRKPKLPID
ncbi:unnamed protein product [Brachionus calyciflorus]|uniref:Integrase zinc-binding domain-containing protein n=1 Tax=Brachionus calyciflorus TaxID=104777 RepID=A0A814GJT8_9BILA|nr:unnamed protein product [Brachionus calyciflorus]